MRARGRLDSAATGPHGLLVVLPYAAVQRVRLTCPHCKAEQTRLAAAVKKGMKIRCDHCKRTFDVTHVEPVVGTAKSGRR